MSKNNRKQSRWLPFRLEHDGTLYGCYEKASTALSIAQSLGGYWKIFDQADRLIDQSGG